MTTENEKAREAKRRSKDAFDGQAATYDEDMHIYYKDCFGAALPS